MKQLLDNIKKIENGFNHIIEAGDIILSNKKLDQLDIALKFLKDETYQVRLLSVYLLGQLSPDNSKALKILETKVAKDDNWRVQEMLAKSLDHYCKAVGYEKSLNKIDCWLSDTNPNLKRAVIEGLRIWTSRPYFKNNPIVAIKLISKHKADESEYLRKSVGNALRDISKKYKNEIDNEISKWDLSDKRTEFTYKLVQKKKNTSR
jgi:3-methyladenine DNA glycosylase AlkC